jgi:hypothetical protein
MNIKPTKKLEKKMAKLDRLNKKGVKGNKRAAKKSILLAQELDIEYRRLCWSCKLHTIFSIIF